VGIVCRKIWALARIPVLLGYRPVSIELRLGPHSGNVQYARSKRIPRAASRSMLGVLARGSP
jgi:hypothetical protein